MDVTLSQYRIYYKWLAVKIACAIVIVAVVPLVVMAAFSRHFFTGSYKQKVLEHLTALVCTQQQKIGEFVTERLDALRLIGLTTTFEQLGDETTLHDRLATLQQIFGKSLVGLTLYNSEGDRISSVGSAEMELNKQLGTDTLAKVLESGSYVGGTYNGTANMQHFILGVNVKPSAEKGILVATVVSEALSVLLADPKSGQASKAFVVDRKGTIVASGTSGGPLARSQCSEMQYPDTSRANDVIVAETGHGDALCIRMNLKNSDWVLEFAANTEEAYGAFSQPRLLALSTLLLGIAGIVAVAFLISIRFSKYVARVDQEKQLINEQVVHAGKLAALGEMASGMAHEINNPVGIMVQEAQWIEALVQRGEKSLADNIDEIKTSLSEIKSHGTRCRDIIIKLINFTRRDEPVVQALQLNELIREIMGLCQQRALLMNIELRLNLEPELPTVGVAPSEVQQVLVNLVNNSLDAMEQSGGAIEVRTSARARYAVVDVEDTGPGIPVGNLSRVFEPFFSTKPEGKGTGLGLSICYTMMKKMKGDITVTSEEGKGTTFHLFFPLQDLG
jgi:two-component system, NtrC family, sensor kinase